jgi:putative glutamine amidotransferase
VFFGGKISKNLAELTGVNHAGTKHKIYFINSPICSAGETIVNSYHNHGVITSDLANSMRAFVFSQDTCVVEGIYHPTYPIIGIQWHPERNTLISKRDKQLILDLFNVSLPRSS